MTARFGRGAREAPRRVYCPACRSVYSGVEAACYACGAPAAGAIPFEPGDHPGELLVAERPAAVAAPPGPSSATLSESSALRLVLGGALGIVVLLALIVALLPDSGPWLAGAGLLVVAAAIPFVLPRLVAADFSGQILRYEMLIAVVAIVMIAGQMLPPEVRLALLVVFGVAAWIIGRGKGR